MAAIQPLSTVRDINTAGEMLAHTQNAVVAQAFQALLAQASGLPQGVLHRHMPSRMKRPDAISHSTEANYNGLWRPLRPSGCIE